jgi:hypothetical protein
MPCGRGVKGRGPFPPCPQSGIEPETEVNMKHPQPEIIHSFDKFRLISSTKLEEFIEIFNLQDLEKHCKNLNIGNMEYDRSVRYKTWLDASLPTNGFFSALLDMDKILHLPLGKIWNRYAISLCEIAADEIHPSRLETINRVEKLGKGTRMKWAPERYTRDRTKRPRDKSKPDNGAYGPVTYYKKSKKCTNRLYPRHSKVNEKPAVHNEFALESSRDIRKQLGISYLADLINYDLKTGYENYYKRRISDKNDIDYEKLAKWQLGISRWKTPNKIRERLRKKEKNLPFHVIWAEMRKNFEGDSAMTEYYRERQIQRWNLAKSRRKDHVASKWDQLLYQVECLKRHPDFENAHTMLKYYGKMKKRIKRKIGRPTDYKRRILKTNFYRFLKSSDVE